MTISKYLIFILLCNFDTFLNADDTDLLRKNADKNGFFNFTINENPFKSATSL